MSLEQKEIIFLNDFEIKGNICFGYVEGEDIEGILDDFTNINETSFVKSEIHTKGNKRFS